MKKQIGLIALSTLIIACVAFSGVASAQSSGVQVYFFESPYCGVCDQVKTAYGERRRADGRARSLIMI